MMKSCIGTKVVMLQGGHKHGHKQGRKQLQSGEILRSLTQISFCVFNKFCTFLGKI